MRERAALERATARTVEGGMREDVMRAVPMAGCEFKPACYIGSPLVCGLSPTDSLPVRLVARLAAVAVAVAAAAAAAARHHHRRGLQRSCHQRGPTRPPSRPVPATPAQKPTSLFGPATRGGGDAYVARAPGICTSPRCHRRLLFFSTIPPCTERISTVLFNLDHNTTAINVWLYASTLQWRHARCSYSTRPSYCMRTRISLGRPSSSLHSQAPTRRRGCREVQLERQAPRV